MHDLVIENVIVWAGNRPKPEPGWLAIKAGRFSAVGDRDTQPPQGLERIDGNGKTILPSFVDCHTHITAGAIASVCRNGWSLKSKEELLAAVEAAAKEDANGWLIFFHVGWHCPEIPVPPTAQELEDASGGRKVFIVCESLHRGILSESGLQACNVSQHMGTEFVETKRGVMNGMVWEHVFSACMTQVLNEFISTLTKGDLKAIVQAEINRHLACGITDAHDPGVTFDLCPLMVDLNQETALRLSWSEIGAHGTVSSAGDGQPLDNFGDGPSSAKVFTDGAHRCAVCVDATQAMIMTVGAIADAFQTRSHHPIANMLREDFAIKGGKFHRVGALFEAEQLTEKLSALAETHERIKIHALGNHAVEMACDCIVESGITTRVCIEHATILDSHNFEKLAKLGVQVSAQPGFLPVYGPLFANMRLSGRYRGLPLRSLLDHDVNLILSSDYPCGPLDPLHNMRCAVERKIENGQVYCENEAIWEEEAVYGYTIAGGMGITGEKKAGVVAGALADFVVLSGNPFNANTVVESTWVEGKTVYQR